jgi:hypothetical protein
LAAGVAAGRAAGVGVGRAAGVCDGRAAAGFGWAGVAAVPPRVCADAAQASAAVRMTA